MTKKIELTQAQAELVYSLIEEEIARLQQTSRPAEPRYHKQQIEVLKRAGEKIFSTEEMQAKQEQVMNKIKAAALVTDRPAYYDSEGGSMCNGIGRSYF